MTDKPNPTPVTLRIVALAVHEILVVSLMADEDLVDLLDARA